MWPEDGSLSLFSVSVGFDGEHKEINKKGIGKGGGRIVLHIRRINVTLEISIHKAIIKIIRIVQNIVTRIVRIS